MLSQNPKQKTCSMCPSMFTPRSSMQVVCSTYCSIKLGQGFKKAREQAKKAERVETKRRKEAIKSIAELIAEAQTAFNAFIRQRDKGTTCICCGKPFEPSRPGGSVDAGHYLARGGSTHLRFNEDNCFAQRKNCNRPGGTTREKFKAGVLARIGQERLDAIENSYEVHKWTREELIAIKQHYRARLKELKRSGDE